MIPIRLPLKTRFSAMAALLLALLLFPPAVQALSGQLNVNTATLEELQQLPFIGETRARAIIDYRLRQGGLRDLDELREIEAIGDSTFKAIRPYLLLTGPSSLRLEKEAGESGAGFELRSRIFTTSPGEIILLPDELYYETLLHYLRQAQHRIDLSMFIFKTTSSRQNRPARLMRELMAAAGRGVRVNLLLENSDHYEDLSRDNKKTAEQLRRRGVEIAFAEPRRTNHTKLVIIDGRYCFVGSHNLTHAALARNYELSLLIDNRRLAAELLDYIAGIRTN